VIVVLTGEAHFSSALSRIVVAWDGEEYLLGRPDRGLYVVVPQPGAVLIEALQSGESMATAVARAGETAGQPVDGEDFLARLSAVGILEIAGPITPASARKQREIRWIHGVSPTTAGRLFGPIALLGYGVAAVFVTVVFITVPDLFPNGEHWWWLPDPALSILFLFPAGLLLMACHEAWHWLAGRALGIPAIFRVSYRGIFLVFETDLTQIVTLPRRRRYIAFLAGIFFDVVVLAAALGLRLTNRIGLLALAGWIDRLLAAIVLMQLTAVVWQWAALFMRSDGYAVLANALRCHDLYRATWLTTKDMLWKLTAVEAKELVAISEHDRRVAKWFWLVYVAGFVAMGFVLLRFIIPMLVGMFTFMGHNLANPSLTSVAFFESVMLIAIMIGRYAVIPGIAARERRLRKDGVLR
jgi:putative peptide zinc metalloprotease protein